MTKAGVNIIFFIAAATIGSVACAADAFRSVAPPSELASQPTRVVVADFDGDGDGDIAAAATTSIVVFLGDGKGRFEAGAVVSGKPADSVAAADLNGDSNI